MVKGGLTMDARIVVEQLGGAAHVARKVKRTTAAVCMWKRVPIHHVHAIVKLSAGKYTAEQLRPDVFLKAA